MKGFIYKITSPSTEEIYIGSTIHTLEERFRCHHRVSNKTNSKLITAFGDAKIECLEEIEFEDEDTLRLREGEYIRQYWDKCVNRFIPGRTKKEWVADNLDKVRENMRQWHKDNPDKYKEKKRLKRSEKVKCDMCNIEISRGELSRHKKRSNCKSN